MSSLGSYRSHDQEAHEGQEGHGYWMMIACCIPMLVIAIVLVATGVVGAGFIFITVMCTAMMAMMMRGMSSSNNAGKYNRGRAVPHRW